MASTAAVAASTPDATLSILAAIAEDCSDADSKLDLLATTLLVKSSVVVSANATAGKRRAMQLKHSARVLAPPKFQATSLRDARDVWR